MSTATTTIKPAEGTRVRITSMPGGYALRRVGTVSNDYYGLTAHQIGVKVDDLEAPSHQNGVWIVDGWEVIQSPLPEVGAKVTPCADLNGDWHYLDERYRDKVGTVTGLHPASDGRYRITAEFQSVQKPDDTIEWSFYEWRPVLDTDIVIETIPKADHDRAIEAKDAEIARLSELVRQAHAAFEVASGIFIEEANDRNWCEQYDNIIDRCNSEMPGPYRFEERESEFEVEVEIEFSGTYTTTVTVTARSQADADERVSDDVSSYVDDPEDIVTDNIRYTSITIDDVSVA